MHRFKEYCCGMYLLQMSHGSRFRWIQKSSVVPSRMLWPGSYQGCLQSPRRYSSVIHSIDLAVLALALPVGWGLLKDVVCSWK